MQPLGGTEAIESNIKSFLEGSQVLLDALDEVGKLHPFIGGYPILSKARTLTDISHNDSRSFCIQSCVEVGNEAEGQ